MKCLQIKTPDGWKWIFCWSITDGKIITTERKQAAIRDEGDNLNYFQNRTQSLVRSFNTREPAE